MNQKIISLVCFLTVSVEASGLNDIAVDGYFRSTYHVHDLKNDKTYRDDGIGGKLHFKTASYEGLSLGAS
ncbi:MAG: Unknown protein, partial [uncultured Sulfurovum sp.]